MCDQLRQDYLSCYGHSTLSTPNIDSLAKRGVLFSNAYCQSPICAASRTSFYSGRYVSSHGVMGNNDAAHLDEVMIGDYLMPLGFRSAVVGKTHCHKNLAEITRLGIDTDSDYAKASQTGGFEPFESHEGLYPDPILPKNLGYLDFLKRQGYPGPNPWDRCANSGIDAEGNRHSGWALRSAKYPAAIDEAHSETAYTTRRAMDFIDQAGNQPWCLHLSYIKPHWPIIAPAPYHNMYGSEDIQPVVCDRRELEYPHPVYQAFTQTKYSRSYARQDVRDTVIPVYMGLIRQIDDHLGRLFDFLRQRDLDGNTLIVFTTDHGDYLGDHWLGEKDLFHDVSAKVPMIIVDPREQADSTRGKVNDAFIESVDILPSFVEFAGGSVCRERVEGRSLIPLLQGQEPEWRNYTISEIDYSDRDPRRTLQLEPYQSRAIMVRNQQWKYIYHLAFRPQLFDLKTDPDELIDLGDNDKYRGICADMKDLIFQWNHSLKRRTGLDYDRMAELGYEVDESHGIIIGQW